MRCCGASSQPQGFGADVGAHLGPCHMTGGVAGPSHAEGRPARSAPPLPPASAAPPPSRCRSTGSIAAPRHRGVSEFYFIIASAGDPSRVLFPGMEVPLHASMPAWWCMVYPHTGSTLDLQSAVPLGALHPQLHYVHASMLSDPASDTQAAATNT